MVFKKEDPLEALGVLGDFWGNEEAHYVLDLYLLPQCDSYVKRFFETAREPGVARHVK